MKMVVLTNFVALIVLILIILSSLRYEDFPPYLVMMFSASLILFLRIYDFKNVSKIINLDLIFFIFGFLIITKAVEQTSFFEEELYRFLSSSTGKKFFIKFSLIFGVIAAFLTNDIAAIIGVPIVVQLCKKRGEESSNLLMLLMYSVTLGSIFSPVGNPQNMLIIFNSDMKEPFISFFSMLLLPSIISLILVGLGFYYLWKRKNNNSIMLEEDPSKKKKTPEKENNKRSFEDWLTILLFVLTILLLLLDDITTQFFDFILVPHLGVVPLMMASVTLVIRRDREKVIQETNWRIILFFLFMFVVVAGLLESSLIQKILALFIDNSLPLTIRIMISSFVLSPLISNVPYVQMFLTFAYPNNTLAPEKIGILLALFSTMAGNLLPFAAASNIIVLEEAKRFKIRLSIKKFVFYGVVITFFSTIIYLFYIWLITTLLT